MGTLELRITLLLLEKKLCVTILSNYWYFCGLYESYMNISLINAGFY